MKNERKTIFGWCMYDWANSAYAVTIVTALLPIFFVAISPHWEQRVDSPASSDAELAEWQFGLASHHGLDANPVPERSAFGFIALLTPGGDASTDATYILQSPSFPSRRYTAIRLRFHSFLHASPEADAVVELFVDERPSSPLLRAPARASVSGGWQEMEAHLKTSVWPEGRARFHFAFSPRSSPCVWAIDDIEVRGITSGGEEEWVFPPVTFETAANSLADRLLVKLSRYLPFLHIPPQYRIPNDFYLELLGIRIHTSPTVLWGTMVGVSAFFVFLFAPVLGAIADFSVARKRFLMLFAHLGSLFAILLFFCQTGEVAKTLLFFLMSQVGFVAANVFYDSFLPHIVTEDKLDWVSGKGFAYGYVGGGLQFAIALGLIVGHDTFGIQSRELATRIAMAMAGLWWAGFSIVTWVYLKEPAADLDLPSEYRDLPRPIAYLRLGFDRTIGTTRKVRRYRHLLLFLIAFMIYSDGIQTVLGMATMYGRDELQLSPAVLMATLLVIQMIAAGGALLFGKLAGWIGTKHAIMLSLALWSGVVIYAYWMHNATEYFILGIIVGLVMGGSQALSRSFYGSMIPEEASAEFYGFYSVFSKFSAIWGPLAFAMIRQLTGTARLSILSLAVFFVTGLIVLAFVKEASAREVRTANSV